MQEQRSLNVFNCIFFSAATSLALAMAAPTWRYGFFLTPFPAILSGLFLLYLTCLVVSLVDTFNPVPWLGLPMRKATGLRGGGAHGGSMLADSNACLLFYDALCRKQLRLLFGTSGMGSAHGRCRWLPFRT